VSFAEFTNQLSLDLHFGGSFAVPDIDIWGFRDPWASVFGIEFPSIDFSVLVPSDLFGGIAVPPVLAAPVFERTGGEAPGTASPLEPDVPVSIFSDIVSVFTGPSDVGTGGAGIFGDILGDIILKQTTTAEERVLGGFGLPGDIAKAIGNLGGQISTGQSLLQTFQPSGGLPPVGILDTLTGGSISVAPCPSPGGSQGFPAGSCLTINDWQQLGAPKGFEVAGVSAGGTLILRKKRRRRRRGGLTKGMMTDVDYLARKLGKPAAETYLNRVL